MDNEIEVPEPVEPENDGDEWVYNDIDSGRYDDDPSPYDGTYSEE